jgi:hypothetical protein
MALTQKGKFYYGDTRADIREELTRYSSLNGYPTAHFADAVCQCGSNGLRLLLDDTEGVAVRQCTQCRTEHPIGDAAEYLEEATLEECECPCGSAVFEITIGVALYPNSEDVRWTYVGCRCPRCNLTACYGDWKSDSGSHVKLLENV